MTGTSGGAVLVLHDITDLKRADQVRRDFVANVSHELRTPLTAIRGYVEALMDEAPDPLQTQHFLEIVSRHSARMERLVTDLLRLARLDARQELLDVAPCEVQQIIGAVVADLSQAIEAKKQVVTVSVAPDAGMNRRRSSEAARHSPQSHRERAELLTRRHTGSD